MATDCSACKFCGKDFTVPYKSIKRLYCSHKCANIATAESREKRVKFTCKICGKGFEVVKGAVKVRQKTSEIQYCSKKCMGLGMRKRETVRCLNCGEGFETTRNNFCSRVCACEYKKKMNGIGGHWYENGYKVLWNGGRPVKEHIYTMERHIGRKIKQGEVVHHKNGVRDDNRIENLEIMSHAEHSSFHRKAEIKAGAELFGGVWKREILS